MQKLTREDCRQALLGGLLLGGGGGGLLSEGLAALEETFTYTDAITLLDVDELKDDDIVANVSTLGAPSAMDVHLTPQHWKTALKNFEAGVGQKIAGFTSCENGAISTANGWIISALTGIPIVDAPSNGRAHPTGTMGSIGLNTVPDYITTQAACGGEGKLYIETTARGAIAPVSSVIRHSAAVDGGMVAVIRNPVTAAYLKEHAAVGAFRQAMEIGAIFQGCKDGEAFVNALKEKYDAKVLLRGKIADYELKMEGGYDIGHLNVKDGSRSVRFTFWNEYMFVEEDGKRLATFPDLLCTLDAATGEAVSSAEASDGREVYALVIPKEKLILGDGMHQKELFDEAGKILGADMTACNASLFQ